LSTTLDLTDLNHKIGQLFMLGIPGPFLDEQTKTLIRDYNLGGIILFSRNIHNPIQLTELCRDIQKTSDHYHRLPLFIAVDQEGGQVARLKKPFTLFPGNGAIGADPDAEEKAEEFGRITAIEMGMVGLNMDLAPVMDVAHGVPQGKVEKHLEGRIFSHNPTIVGRLGGVVIRALQGNGVMAVAKHFPGLGRADLDPHERLPNIGLGAEEMEAVHLPPFQAAIQEGVSAIMTSHAVYPALDPDWSATLSSIILNDLLRNRLGFKGLIMTDDLEMGAIVKKWSVAEGATRAFEVGADILLICKDQGHFLESIGRIRKKLLQNEIGLGRLHESNERIIKAKSKFLKTHSNLDLADVDAYFRKKDSSLDRYA
jgi:beta-N-acetylhexosaminidase